MKADCARVEQLKRLFTKYFESRLSDVGPHVEATTETCFYQGLETFTYFIEYAAICRDMSRALPFLIAAEASLSKTVSQSAYPEINGRQGDANVSYKKSVTHFCHAAVLALKEGAIQTTVAEALRCSANAISSALTETSIDAAVSKASSTSDWEAWSGYAARYLGLCALCRLHGVVADEAPIPRLGSLARFKPYGELNASLGLLLSSPPSSAHVPESYRRACEDVISLNNYEMGLVHGFTLYDALVFSTIRWNGDFSLGVRSMFMATP